MAKIFSSPVAAPDYQGGYKDWQEKDKKYIADVKADLVKAGFKDAGEVVRFPWADGYAAYMVASLKPLHLIHLVVGDAWRLPEAHERGIRVADIKQQIAFRKSREGK